MPRGGVSRKFLGSCLTDLRERLSANRREALSNESWNVLSKEKGVH